MVHGAARLTSGTLIIRFRGRKENAGCVIENRGGNSELSGSRCGVASRAAIKRPDEAKGKYGAA